MRRLLSVSKTCAFSIYFFLFKYRTWWKERRFKTWFLVFLTQKIKKKNNIEIVVYLLDKQIKCYILYDSSSFHKELSQCTHTHFFFSWFFFNLRQQVESSKAILCGKDFHQAKKFFQQIERKFIIYFYWFFVTLRKGEKKY